MKKILSLLVLMFASQANATFVDDNGWEWSWSNHTIGNFQDINTLPEGHGFASIMDVSNLLGH